MSFVSTSTIDDIAHSLDISKLSHEAAKALAPDAEYRMRELIQVCAHAEGMHMAASPVRSSIGQTPGLFPFESAERIVCAHFLKCPVGRGEA